LPLKLKYRPLFNFKKISFKIYTKSILSSPSGIIYGSSEVRLTEHVLSHPPLKFVTGNRDTRTSNLRFEIFFNRHFIRLEKKMCRQIRLKMEKTFCGTSNSRPDSWEERSLLECWCAISEIDSYFLHIFNISIINLLVFHSFFLH